MSTHNSPAATSATRSAVTVPTLGQMRARGEPISMLTCYDASFAALLDASALDCILIGDSLGMVVQGHRSTLPVSLADMTYHTACVARATRRALVITDMPFGAYQGTREAAYSNAVQLMQAGAQMVKLEGGAWLAPTVAFFVERGIPVCGHLGLTPQSVNVIGGYRVQGKGEDAAALLKSDALALEQAGATMIVLELMPSTVGAAVTQALNTAATIGIGAGPQCNGQVLVLHDMLDIFPGKKPRFVRNFMSGAPSIAAAIDNYVHEVKARTFPATEHAY